MRQSIIYKIENQIIDSALIGVNSGMNFGRFDHYSGVPQKYSISLPILDFIKLLEGEYNRIKNEIKVDDDLYHDESEFSQVGYCSLNELIDYHGKELALIFTTYLREPLFDRLIKNSSEVKFVINSLDGITKKDDVLEIFGQCFIIN